MSASISGVSQLVTVIRAQMSALAAPAGRRLSGGARTSAGRRASDRSLGALIAVRVSHISPDDPQRGRKAFRVFLELVLLTHLGETLMNDPKFYQLLDDVQRALEGDSASAPLVAQAVEHLLSRAPDV